MFLNFNLSSNFFQKKLTFILRMGMSGEECINLIICEIARGEIFVDENGLIGDVLHVIFS